MAQTIPKEVHIHIICTPCTYMYYDIQNDESVISIRTHLVGFGHIRSRAYKFVMLLPEYVREIQDEIGYPQSSGDVGRASEGQQVAFGAKDRFSRGCLSSRPRRTREKKLPCLQYCMDVAQSFYLLLAFLLVGASAILTPFVGPDTEHIAGHWYRVYTACDKVRSIAMRHT